MEQHIDLLGYKAKDKVTGFTGVIISVSFDLYGCVQAVVMPPAKDGNETVQGEWFDVTRLQITGKKRVMELPDYESGYTSEGRKGCAAKPLP